MVPTPPWFQHTEHDVEIRRHGVSSDEPSTGRKRRLRSLFPEQSERVNLVEMYSRGVEVPEDRPFVRVNMISTLDGATSFAGRSGGLGGPGDKLLFSVLRSLSDLVLVGAGTARAEHYGQAKLPVEVQRMRESRGQRPLPSIAVVTQSLTVDWASPRSAARLPGRSSSHRATPALTPWPGPGRWRTSSPPAWGPWTSAPRSKHWPNGVCTMSSVRGGRNSTPAWPRPSWSTSCA